MDKYLKTYLKENFDFKALKKAGFFSREIKSTDYEKQATRICQWFGFKNIYDYSINKPIQFIHSIGIATGSFKNKFGEDILEAIKAEQEKPQ